MPNKTIKLVVIKESLIAARSVFKMDGEGTVIIRGDGNTNYVCGNCSATLIEDFGTGAISNIVLHCNSCGAYNDVLISNILETISKTPSPEKIAEDIRALADTAEREDFTQEKYFQELERINPILKFLIDVIPANSKEWKKALAWVLAILIPLIYDKCKGGNQNTVQNTTYNIIIKEAMENKKDTSKKVSNKKKNIRLPKKRGKH